MLNNIERCVNFHYFVYFYVAVCKYLVTELNIRLAKTADSKAVIETGYSIDKKKVVPYVTSYVLPCSAYNYGFFLWKMYRYVRKIKLRWSVFCNLIFSNTLRPIIVYWISIYTETLVTSLI